MMYWYNYRPLHTFGIVELFSSLLSLFTVCSIGTHPVSEGHSEIS